MFRNPERNSQTDFYASCTYNAVNINVFKYTTYVVDSGIGLLIEKHADCVRSKPTDRMVELKNRKQFTDFEDETRFLNRQERHGRLVIVITFAKQSVDGRPRRIRRPY